jgi:hypothetical protein
VARKLKVPHGDGVLICEEVMVVCRLMWNSRSHQLVGLVMSHEELASLTDVYQLTAEQIKRHTFYNFYGGI